MSWEAATNEKEVPENSSQATRNANNTSETVNSSNNNSYANAVKSTSRNSKIPPIVVDDNGNKQKVINYILKITEKVNFSPINARKFRIYVTDNLENYQRVLEYIKTSEMIGQKQNQYQCWCATSS